MFSGIPDAVRQFLSSDSHGPPRKSEDVLRGSNLFGVPPSHRPTSSDVFHPDRLASARDRACGACAPARSPRRPRTVLLIQREKRPGQPTEPRAVALRLLKPAETLLGPAHTLELYRMFPHESPCGACGTALLAILFLRGNTCGGACGAVSLHFPYIFLQHRVGLSFPGLAACEEPVGQSSDGPGKMFKYGRDLLCISRLVEEERAQLKVGKLLVCTH
eukprot:gene23651-biopygen4349